MPDIITAVCMHRGQNGANLLQQANKEKRQVIFKRAEKYVQEYRDAEREKIRLARAARADDSAYVPAEARLIFVVRIKGINKVSTTSWLCFP